MQLIFFISFQERPASQNPFLTQLIFNRNHVLPKAFMQEINLAHKQDYLKNEKNITDKNKMS